MFSQYFQNRTKYWQKQPKPHWLFQHLSPTAFKCSPIGQKSTQSGNTINVFGLFFSSLGCEMFKNCKFKVQEGIVWWVALKEGQLLLLTYRMLKALLKGGDQLADDGPWQASMWNKKQKETSELYWYWYVQTTQQYVRFWYECKTMILLLFVWEVK